MADEGREIPIRVEKTPQELAEEFASQADELIERVKKVDQKYLTDKEDGSGNGIRFIDTNDYFYRGHGAEELSVGNEINNVPPPPKDLPGTINHSKGETARIIRHRRRTKEEEAAGELTGRYEFVRLHENQASPYGDNTHVNKATGKIDYHLEGDFKRGAPNAEVVIKNVQEAVSAAEARQLAAS